MCSRASAQRGHRNRFLSLENCLSLLGIILALCSFFPFLRSALRCLFIYLAAAVALIIKSVGVSDTINGKFTLSNAMGSAPFGLGASRRAPRRRMRARRRLMTRTMMAARAQKEQHANPTKEDKTQRFGPPVGGDSFGIDATGKRRVISAEQAKHRTFSAIETAAITLKSHGDACFTFTQLVLIFQ